MCDDCVARGDALVRRYRHADQKADRLAVKTAAERLAGGARIFSALPSVARKALREKARELKEFGAQVATAAARQAARIKEGHVYIIVSPLYPKRLKIGSAVDVESRLGDAQTWCPHRSFRAAHAIFVPDRNLSERRIHAQLEAYRLEGEWFALPLRQAKDTLDKEAKRARLAR
jgi:hypothetical protein